MLQNAAVSGHHNNSNASSISPVNSSASNESLLSHRTTININPAEENAKISENVTPNCDNTVNSTDQLDSLELILESRSKEISEIDESNVDFSSNKEQWQRRANSQSHTNSILKQNRHSEPYLQRQSHTPDLVMDLPLIGNCSPQETKKKSISVSGNLDYSEDTDTVSLKSNESPTDPDSPETAAETFAKQNQCTLKKNTKLSDTNVFSDNKKSDYIAITSPATERKCVNNSTTSTFKPQLKSKPPLLKKPVFSVNLNATSVRKDQEDDFPM